MTETLQFSDLTLQQPFKIFKADGGGITFVKLTLAEHQYWQIALIAKECPHEFLYTIEVNYSTSTITLTQKTDGKNLLENNIPNSLTHDTRSQKLWLSWYNDTIQMGAIESSKFLKPFLTYEKPTDQPSKELIGFVRFTSNQYIDFMVDASPNYLKPLSLKNVKGELRWVKVIGGKLPKDALIGGFEKEPLYIARALHGRSMCPGKYIKSTQKAYIPWGHNEHTKTIFEVLCGFNGYWVMCKDELIPENVFRAGNSEVNGEDIYIGRAMIGDDLVVGKVHMLYKTCYLPYKGKEVEKSSYEILVRGDKPIYGESIQNNCLVNPLRALQPCMKY